MLEGILHLDSADMARLILLSTILMPMSFKADLLMSTCGLLRYDHYAAWTALGVPGFLVESLHCR